MESEKNQTLPCKTMTCTLKEYIEQCDRMSGNKEIFDKYTSETGQQRRIDRVLDSVSNLENNKNNL